MSKRIIKKNLLDMPAIIATLAIFVLSPLIFVGSCFSVVLIGHQITLGVLIGSVLAVVFVKLVHGYYKRRYEKNG